MRELIFGVIGGTALLMYGVNKMGDGLEKASGDSMKKILTVLTGKVWSAFLIGILLTALVQSSTAITVLTVGFVNSGLMGLSQAIGIIFGANIGTTITGQLMSLSFNFSLTDIAIPILGIGFFISQIFKNKKVKNLGQALMGFGMMFLGLQILNSGIPHMQESESLRYFFTTYASIPIVGILLGAFATAMVHSSAATLGFVMVLSKAGLIDLNSAVYIILGDNIGTCITAQLASMTGNINARRTAWGHTLYNAFGVVLILVIFPFFMKFVSWFTVTIRPNADITTYIANSHTLFNSLNALIFLPLTKYYVKFLNTIIRPKDDAHKKKQYLDRLLLETPLAALQGTRSEIIQGTEIVKTMMGNVMNLFYTEDTKKFALLADDEDTINLMQKDVTRYIVELSERELSDSESIMVPATVNCINNIERIGDRIIDISELAEKIIENELEFTESAFAELEEIEIVIMEMFENLVSAIENRDKKSIERIQVLEDMVDELSEKFQSNHIRRLNDGSCNVDAGVIFIDVVSHMERIADHIYKIRNYTKDELFGEERNDK